MKTSSKRNYYNTKAISALITKYGVSRRYVTMALSGDRNGITAETIKKDYKILIKGIDNKINQYLENGK